MTQNIKIGVNADTTGAADQIKQVDGATKGLAGSIDAVAKATKAAADGMRRMEGLAQRLKGVQSILSKEFGKPIGEADAREFLRNYERIRSGSGIGTRSTRGFDSFENWYQGHSTMFRRQADAERARRYVMAVGMQNTGYARENGVPAFPQRQPGERPPPQEPVEESSNFGSSVRRAQSTAMGFGRGMLALAGITSIIDMASSAIEMATEEATAADTLKRRMGDLGVGFDFLKEQVRSAGAGMGLTFVESVRLAQQFTHTVGSLRGNDLSGSLRTAIGFGRAEGLDPTEATEFFGQMHRLQVRGTGDQDDRRFALMIATAIERGGYSAKADEVLSAVANFASTAARMSLTAPNADSYAGYLTSLTRTGAPGLDPTGAASLLSAADASVRRGGGMGEAGLNFTYGALRRYTRGLTDPFQSQALFEGGLMGTTAQVFDPKGPLGRFMGARGVKGPALNGETNFEKVRALLDRQYGGNPMLEAEAAKNYFGLSSIAQAAALLGMNQEDLTGSEAAALSAGVKITDLSASGIAGLAKVAGAKNFGALSGIYNDTVDRADISKPEREALQKALGSGDTETLRNALAKVIGTHDQEDTEGSRTRRSISDMKDTLAGLGSGMLSSLNSIREWLVIIAKALAPADYQAKIQADLDAKTDFVAKVNGEGDAQTGALATLKADDDKTFAAAQAAAGGKPFDFDKTFGTARHSSFDWITGGREYDLQAARLQLQRKHYQEVYGKAADVGADYVKPFGSNQINHIADLVNSPSKFDDLFAEAAKKYGLDPRELKLKGAIESDLNPAANNGQAFGLMQLTGETADALGVDDVFDPRQSIFAAAKLYADLLKKTGGDKMHADELYYAGSDRNIGKNTIQYGLNTDAARSAIGIGDTPVPGSDAGVGAGRGTSTDLRVHITSDPIMLQDPNGNLRGQGKLRPYADGPPAGAGLSFGGFH